MIGGNFIRVVIQYGSTSRVLSPNFYPLQDSGIRQAEEEIKSRGRGLQVRRMSLLGCRRVVKVSVGLLKLSCGWCRLSDDFGEPSQQIFPTKGFIKYWSFCEHIDFVRGILRITRG